MSASLPVLPASLSQYDNCYAQDYDIRERYSDMRDALNKTGRPI